MSRIRIVLIGCLSAIAGCAEGGPVAVEARDGPAMRKNGLGNTYAWFQARNNSAENPDVHAVITDAIDAELAKKGFTKTDQKTASFWVGYRVIRENKTDSSVYPHGVTYPKGTLIIRLTDPTTKKAIWAGSATAHLLTNATPEERMSRAQEGIRKLLDLMPTR